MFGWPAPTVVEDPARRAPGIGPTRIEMLFQDPNRLWHQTLERCAPGLPDGRLRRPATKSAGTTASSLQLARTKSRHWLRVPDGSDTSAPGNSANSMKLEPRRCSDGGCEDDPAVRSAVAIRTSLSDAAGRRSCSRKNPSREQELTVAERGTSTIRSGRRVDRGEDHLGDVSGTRDERQVAGLDPRDVSAGPVAHLLLERDRDHLVQRPDE